MAGITEFDSYTSLLVKLAITSYDAYDSWDASHSDLINEKYRIQIIYFSRK